MKERARLSGGQLEVHSKVGEGTAVILGYQVDTIEGINTYEKVGHG